MKVRALVSVATMERATAQRDDADEVNDDDGPVDKGKVGSGKHGAFSGLSKRGQSNPIHNDSGLTVGVRGLCWGEQLGNTNKGNL